MWDERSEFLGLSREQKKLLEFEIISDDVRLKISRLFRNITRNSDSNIAIIHKNRIINIARAIEGLSIYHLNSYGEETYLPVEHAWHFGELELIAKRQTTIQLIETLCDLINEDIIKVKLINSIFENDNCQIKFKQSECDIILELDIDNNEDIKDIMSNEHPNIGKLVKRMDLLFQNRDFSGVLHSSASVFETLAKDVIKQDTIENKSLGSFFELYRKKSKLPEKILDSIKEIYDKRNKEPLAGHGSTIESTLTQDEAFFLVEMTKTFIKMERKLSGPVTVV